MTILWFLTGTQSDGLGSFVKEWEQELMFCLRNASDSACPGKYDPKGSCGQKDLGSFLVEVSHLLPEGAMCHKFGTLASQSARMQRHAVTKFLMRVR